MYKHDLSFTWGIFVNLRKWKYYFHKKYLYDWVFCCKFIAKKPSSEPFSDNNLFRPLFSNWFSFSVIQKENRCGHFSFRLIQKENLVKIIQFRPKTWKSLFLSLLAGGMCSTFLGSRTLHFWVMSKWSCGNLRGYPDAYPGFIPRAWLWGWQWRAWCCHSPQVKGLGFSCFMLLGLMSRNKTRMKIIEWLVHICIKHSSILTLLQSLSIHDSFLTGILQHTTYTQPT